MKPRGPSPSLAYVPAHPDHEDLVLAARGCHACDLYKNATQTVFGEGPIPAPVVLVGEQPGDSEDLEGRPFVGPAGRVLDAALEEAGVPRREVYVTNAVKHFKWEPRGKRRLHARPNAAEIHACHGWLEAELELVHPTVVVCLGATAAQALLGPSFSITKSRGEIFESTPWAPHVLATYHPSALLRVRADDAAYQRMRRELAEDLARIPSLASFRGSRSSEARRLPSASPYARRPRRGSPSA